MNKVTYIKSKLADKNIYSDSLCINGNKPLSVSKIKYLLEERDCDVVIYTVELGDDGTPYGFCETCIVDEYNNDIVAIWGYSSPTCDTKCEYWGKDYGKTWIAYEKNPFV